MLIFFVFYSWTSWYSYLEICLLLHLEKTILLLNADLNANLNASVNVSLNAGVNTGSLMHVWMEIRMQVWMHVLNACRNGEIRFEYMSECRFEYRFECKSEYLQLKCTIVSVDKYTKPSRKETNVKQKAPKWFVYMNIIKGKVRWVWCRDRYKWFRNIKCWWFHDSGKDIDDSWVYLYHSQVDKWHDEFALTLYKSL